MERDGRGGLERSGPAPVTRQESLNPTHQATPPSDDHFLVKGQDLWPLSKGRISSPGHKSVKASFYSP